MINHGSFLLTALRHRRAAGSHFAHNEGRSSANPESRLSSVNNCGQNRRLTPRMSTLRPIWVRMCIALAPFLLRYTPAARPRSEVIAPTTQRKPDAASPFWRGARRQPWRIPDECSHGGWSHQLTFSCATGRRPPRIRRRGTPRGTGFPLPLGQVAKPGRAALPFNSLSWDATPNRSPSHSPCCISREGRTPWT